VLSLDGGVELVELMKPRQRMLLLSYGRGSPGNVAFKSGTNKVPWDCREGAERPRNLCASLLIVHHLLYLQ